MRLHEVLEIAIRTVGDIGCDHVPFARTSEESQSQYRLVPSRDDKRGYVLERRRWMGVIYGDALNAWGRWAHLIGFGIESVLADDWRILP